MNGFSAEGVKAFVGTLPPWPSLICIIDAAVLAFTLVLVQRYYARQARQSRGKLLADAAERAPVGLLQVGSDGIIQWANPAELELLGYTRGEYVGKNATEFYADQAEGREVLSRLARGDTLRSHPTKLRARDGSFRDVLISSSTDNTDGKFLRALLFTQDITGRKRAEEEIFRLNHELEQRVQQRTAQLEAANKEMESFSYSVSHDLRAPLRALRGFSEVLLEAHSAQLDATGQELLRRACGAVSQMERLIEDLLKLAQVSRAELQSDEVNLSSLATEIAGELATADSFRAVKFDIAPNCVAVGDPRLVRLALDNLLRNAWKFSSKTQDAHIEFGKTAANGKEQAFFVRDNGAGFDMAYAKKLFGVFQRLHPASKFPGTGVGLATVQRIINRHGGRAWAEGVVNKGATFYFTLPGINHELNKPAMADRT